MALVLLGAIALGCSLFLAKDIDFIVYWKGVRLFLAGQAPLYGPKSGNGVPQEFRYPPVTVLFFMPLAKLPMRAASVCWSLVGWALCAWASALAIRRWKLTFTLTGAALAALVLAHYAFLAAKFGNVQPHLIALTLLAMLCAEDRPAWSGVALAVAVAFKVWPLFFAPWIFVRRRSALLYGVGATALLWLAPGPFFGWARYGVLLRDFFAHAVALAADPEQVWYASQSLRGVLFRFFTHAVPLRDGYPDVSLAALSPVLVSVCNVMLTILAYGYAVAGVWRSPRSRRWLWDAAAFVFFSILEPFSMNSGLISLLPAVLAAACVYSAPRGEYPEAARRWFLAACVLSALASATFYRPLQREVLMLGIHFWLMLALGASLVIAARAAPAPKTR
jgi:hypothetical protein